MRTPWLLLAICLGVFTASGCTVEDWLMCLSADGERQPVTRNESDRKAWEDYDANSTTYEYLKERRDQREFNGE